MKRSIEIDGRIFRERRGVLVEIPKKWVGQTLTPQTKRKRNSKMTRKQKNYFKMNDNRDLGWGKNIYLRYKRGEDIFGEADEY